MLRALRRRHAEVGGDSGFSLIELMVSMTILSIIMGSVIGSFILAQRQVSSDANRLDEGQRATVAEEAMTKALRTAILPKQLDASCTGCDVAAFISGSPTSTAFYADLGNTGSLDGSGMTTDGPSKVSYAVSASGDLTEVVQRPVAHLPSDYNYSWCNPSLVSCVKTSRVIAHGVSTTVSLFTFYDKSGATLTTPLESSTTTLASVDSIDINLNVQASSKAPANSVVTRVTLPNADAALLAVTS